MRWSAGEGSNELRTFLKLNRAASTEACREALQGYATPILNFLCSDNRGDVGLWHMGKNPIRWKGQGRLISDGSTARYEWQGWVPADELPSVRNPSQGFVSSANQAPADDGYPHYLGWPFSAPFRAERINESLKKKDKLSPEDMMALQNDTLSVLARELTPALVAAVRASANQTNGDYKSKVLAPLSAPEEKALALLDHWDFRFDLKSPAATIFRAWLDELEMKMWAPRFGDRSEAMYPPIVRLSELIREEPQSKWFDDPLTERKEALPEAALAAFRGALARLTERFGRDADDWKWERAHTADFRHIALIPGLGDEGYQVAGDRSTIMANEGNHGPNWKLVVALGEKPRAWGIYAGGQSGDPASRHYDEFLEPWRKGEMRELHLLQSPDEQSPRLLKAWQMERP
jgi:penicillin amidase